MDARVCLGGNDVFAGTVHGRSGALRKVMGAVPFLARPAVIEDSRRLRVV